MWEFAITNIAGIRSADVRVEAGLNIVQASNFTGKSSFVKAIQTVVGTSGMYGKAHPLTEGTDRGTVTLDTPEDTYEVQLERTGPGTVTQSGTPMLTDETDRTCARLFAFLGENNPIRARVRNEGDITPLLQAPLDIESIDERIASLRQERAVTDRRLREAEQAVSNLPAVKSAIETLEREITELEDRRDELTQAAVETASAGNEADDKLSTCRSQLRTTKKTISRLDAQIERTEERLESKQSELADLDIPSEPDVTSGISAKEDRIETLALRIELLDGLHRANSRVLQADELELVSDVERNLVADEVGCWVCGETTSEDTIRAKLDKIQAKLQSLRDEKATLEDDISEIEAEQERIQQKRRTRTQLQETIGEHKARLDELRGDIEQARARKSELEQEVAELEATVAQEELAANEELTDVKAKLQTKQDEIAKQRTRLREREETKGEAETLAARKAELDSEIEELQHRKTETQWELKEQFDTAIADVVGRFAPGFDGAHLSVKTDEENKFEQFELVIARDGRETELSTLSEGEQELVGIMVALAGHRTFDVGERAPVVLLDGISQLSASNLRRLTEYLADTADVLVTSAYPEAGEFRGTHISPDEWETVADGEPSVV